MARTLFTAAGAALEVGRELGRGGEGSVFEVPARAKAQVAKLYHKPPDSGKQAKLAFMAAAADPQLLSYVAWPQETLHATPGGAVVGFLMPLVANKAPIHMVYSPAHRRQQYPNAAWDFLLYVARNIAAAFETVHAHGHIIGDVNQNSVMVGKDSKVVLIDSDSFQVNARGVLHLCEVGVSHFTPPELQSLSSFHGFTRTTNHDNFGLALLIFHVLFGGRHPYSGVPLRAGVGDALESDIKGFRYAYARDGHSRGIAPPPRSIALSMLPDAVEAMFHLAFTERGAQGARPDARQWVGALDTLRGRLKKCAASPSHVYSNHLGHCPWCALEQQGVVYFVNLAAAYTQTSTGFVLAQVWAAIQAVPTPPTLRAPSPANITVTGQPMPPLDAGVVWRRRLWRVLAICLGLTIAVAPGSGAFWFGLLFAGVGSLLASLDDSPARRIERERRSSSRQQAKQVYEQLVLRANNEVGPEGFYAKRAELEKLREAHEELARDEKRELSRLEITAEERQRRMFLESCFIDNATIVGLGPTRRAALRSFGIETAADVTRPAVMGIRGFGEGLTRALLDWRASCERRFVFNAATAVSAADRAAVRAKFSARRAPVEAVLARGAAELQARGRQVAGQVATLRPQLEAAARALAQAKADAAMP